AEPAAARRKSRRPALLGPLKLQAPSISGSASIPGYIDTPAGHRVCAVFNSVRCKLMHHKCKGLRDFGTEHDFRALNGSAVTKELQFSGDNLAKLRPLECFVC